MPQQYCTMYAFTSKSVLNMAMVTGCPAERSFSLITENNPTDCTSVSCCLATCKERNIIKPSLEVVAVVLLITCHLNGVGPFQSA